MASLKNVIKDRRDEIIDGIAWVAIYKTGRSWEAGVFWPEDGDYENGFVFSQEDCDAMKAIAVADHKAICVNGYFMGFGEDFTLDEIENKILYFYETRLNQLFGDFLDCLVIPPKTQEEEQALKQFNISYMRNSVPQTILVEASSSNEAGRYFMSQKPDAIFYGVHEASADDMRPGKPVMTVPADFIENIEAVLKQHGLDKPSDESFHYRMLDRLRSDCAYYLGNGNRYAGHLWVKGDVKGHIELMKALWNRFPADGKPEWLPYEKILEYEKEMVEPLKEQSGSVRKYVDKNGIEIKPGMSLRMEDGSVEQVYATTDSYGNPDLGINASNEAYLARHSEQEREFYPLSSFNTRNIEVCGFVQGKSVDNLIYDATAKSEQINNGAEVKENNYFGKE